MASSASQVLLWLPSEQNLSPIRMRCILQNHSQIEQDPPLQLSLSKFSASARFLPNFGLWPFAIPGSVSHGIFCFAGSALVAIGAEPKPNQNEMYSTKPFTNRARPTFTAKSKQIQCFCQVLPNFGLWPFAIPGSVSHGIFCFAGSALVAIGAEPKPNQNEMYSTKPFTNRARPTFTAKSKQIQCFCQVLANFGLWPFAIPGSVSHGIFCFAGSAWAIGRVAGEPLSNGRTD